MFGENAALLRTDPISSHIAETLLENRFSSIGSLIAIQIRIYKIESGISIRPFRLIHFYEADIINKFRWVARAAHFRFLKT